MKTRLLMLAAILSSLSLACEVTDTEPTKQPEAPVSCRAIGCQAGYVCAVVDVDPECVLPCERFTCSGFNEVCTNTNDGAGIQTWICVDADRLESIIESEYPYAG